MSNNRKSRLVSNQQNTVPRRILQSNLTAATAPKVEVRANNGSEPENSPLGAKSKGPGRTTKLLPLIPIEAPVMMPTTSRLAAPQYNTTIRRQEEINTLNQMRTVVTEANITPRSKELIAPKITQKLNFPPDRTVFTDLPTLNVNDSVLVPQKVKRDPKAASSSRAKKPVEPQLADYLEPIEPIIMPLPEPELMLEFPDKKFDYFQLYKDAFYPNK
ncbi:protein PPP1R35 homolog [Drosophila tropicalis]|uniref:protein PPP1R35 homolog n=1 Tax=Drosophila tropicalis TaxID=46794 RepID=UPI0035ABB0D3